MAGTPVRRARRIVESAMAERERLVAAGEMTPEERDAANARDEAMLRGVTAGTADAPKMPTAPKGPTEEWLIDTPAEIAKAYEGRADSRLKMTEEVIDRFLFLIRCGMSVKDTRDGPGAARQCGLHPATVWDRVNSDPLFAKAFRDARDAAAEVLEDEMRAMLPTAMRHPELVRGLEFVAGRLEWLAKVRNKDRYGDTKQSGGGNSVTFNIGSIGTPKAVERVVADVIEAEDVTVTKIGARKRPAIPAVLVSPKEPQAAQ